MYANIYNISKYELNPLDNKKGHFQDISITLNYV
jgi:hypothetical protein